MRKTRIQKVKEKSPNQAKSKQGNQAKQQDKTTKTKSKREVTKWTFYERILMRLFFACWGL